MNQVDLSDVLAVTQQQLTQALQDSAMNAALAMKRQRRIEELETLLREMKGKS
jgi:hypothetical protein